MDASESGLSTVVSAVTGPSESAMKRCERPKEQLLTLDWEQWWSSVLTPAAGRLRLNALDFSDLWDEDDSTEDEGAAPASRAYSRGRSVAPALPPPPPPPPPPLPIAPPTGASSRSPTLRLHWRELRTLAPLPRMTRFGDQTIWTRLEPVNLDENQLEYLFKSKSSSSSFHLLSGQQVIHRDPPAAL